jgi:hypothetical protein
MLSSFDVQVRIIKNCVVKTMRFLMIYSFFSLISTPAQNDDYWSSAPTGKTKIFSVSFVDNQNGLAKSAENDVLFTSDGGRTWNLRSNISFISEKTTPEILWVADIYCSIMKTTDGGITWLSYEEEKQEHFCGVYLKDPNTGYKVASDFLNKVTSEINTHYKNGNLDLLLDRPHQCTEYYKSADEGWALGWCIRNIKKSPSE